MIIRAAQKPPSYAADLVNTGETACVVTCHNYGRFLRVCLRSLVEQTLPLAHIVVVDDASTDDSAAIAREFEGAGVKLISGEWLDFTEARKAGLAALPPCRFLLFVDADNWVSPNFHAELRAGMNDSRVAVAYPTRRGMQDGQQLFDRSPTFSAARFRVQNYVDACALIRAEAYHQSGGWEANDGVTDWRLWLKITRNNWRMACRPNAVLFYRLHGENMSRCRWDDPERYRASNVACMRAGMVVCVVTLFCGRRWALDGYLAGLRGLQWPLENLRLVAIDNSRDRTFTHELRRRLTATGISFSLIRDDGQPVPGANPAEFAADAAERSAHAYELSAHLARLYSRAHAEVPRGADLVLCLEDDIQAPRQTLEAAAWCLYRNPEAGAVSGCVQNRFGEALIAWSGNWQTYASGQCDRVLYAPGPEELLELLASGLMCTVFRRAAWDALVFRPSPLWHPTKRPWYDWAVAMELARDGWKWLLAGAIRCRHWQADGTYLVPAEKPATSSPEPLPDPAAPTYPPTYPPQ